MSTHKCRRWGTTTWEPNHPAYDCSTMNYMKTVQHQCPDTQRKHWHSFIIFKNPIRLPQVKRYIVDNQAHCVPLKTNDMTYLEDGHDTIDGPKEFGELTHQGQRRDIEDFINALESGASEKVLSQDHFHCWAKFKHVISDYRALRMEHKAKYPLESFKWPPLNLEANHFHLYGPPDTGKTQFALAHFQNPLYVRHQDHLAYFYGSDHDGIVIDELSFTHWPVSSVINMLNKKDPAMLHIRYRIAYLPAGTRIIFCSNEPDIFYDATKQIPVDVIESIMSKCTSLNVTERLF